MFWPEYCGIIVRMREFWISNITNRLISLGDLGILLQPYQSVNLLDRKNFPLFTDKHIEQSLISGSLYKRSDKVKVRRISPPTRDLKGASKIGLDEKHEQPSKIRSILEHKEYNYDAEEAGMSDEEYAAENADLAGEEDLGRYKR